MYNEDRETNENKDTTLHHFDTFIGADGAMNGDSHSNASSDENRRRENVGNESFDHENKVSVPEKIEDIIEKLKSDIGYAKSFDVALREMTIGQTKIALLNMSGLVNSELLTEILERLTNLQGRNIDQFSLKSFLKYYIPNISVSVESDWTKVINSVLSGDSAFFVDHSRAAIIMDARSYPARGLEEPSLEKVVRGSRDGFIESLMVNVSLVRRRLRDPKLRYEKMQVGERTKTDVVIAYIEDIVDHQLVNSIRDKIKALKVDGLPLADKQLEEGTIKRGWNPFPYARYSERPDTVSTHLLEGATAIFVDTSPSVMILPTTYSDLMLHAEESRQTPLVGTYLRWVRFSGILASLILLPIWLLFVMHPEFKPDFLHFVGPKETANLPIVIQFILAEIGVDLLRMASVHTPTSLATAMSLVAAILIGDIAVQTGLFVPEVILYMSVAAVGMFATPSYELGLANRLVRLCLIITVSLFGLLGLVVPVTMIVVGLVMGRSMNRPYFWPFIPFDFKAFVNILIRKPVLYNRTRPNIMKPQQHERMPKHK